MLDFFDLYETLGLFILLLFRDVFTLCRFEERQLAGYVLVGLVLSQVPVLFVHEDLVLLLLCLLVL